VVVAAQVEREEEMGMAPDKYSEVFGLAQRGTLAFRDRHFDEVIAEFSLLPRLFLCVQLCMQSSCQCLAVSGLEVCIYLMSVC